MSGSVTFSTTLNIQNVNSTIWDIDGNFSSISLKKLGRFILAILSQIIKANSSLINRLMKFDSKFYTINGSGLKIVKQNEKL